MRAASVQLQARIAAESTTLARLWRVTRSDGEVLRFTDAVRPITIQVSPDVSPEEYRSDITFTSSAIFTSSSMANQQSVTMSIVMDDAGFGEGDLRARLYDGAVSEIMVVDYEFPQYGVIHVFKGIFGVIQLSNQRMAQIEVQPADAAVNGALVGNEKYSQTCRANLGDARCKVNLSALKVAFTVDSASGGSLVASELSQAANHWALGYVKWLTGANAGKTSQVSGSDQLTTSLFLTSQPFYPIEVGDTGEVFPGCDKLRATCIAKFNNLANMRAEPDVPEIAATTSDLTLMNWFTGASGGWVIK